MRPELERIQLIEDYLHQLMTSDQTKEMEIRLLLDDALREDTHIQQQLYTAIRSEGRRQLRRELESIHCRWYKQVVLQKIARLITFLLGAWAWWQWVTN
jgi:hypothetical protein